MRYLPIRASIALASISFIAAGFSGIAHAEPTTKPKDIAPTETPVVSYVGQAADMTRPAFVPAFAKVSNVPALQAERDYAQMHTIPAIPAYFGYPIYFSFPGGHYGYRPAHSSVK